MCWVSAPRSLAAEAIRWWSRSLSRSPSKAAWPLWSSPISWVARGIFRPRSLFRTSTAAPHWWHLRTGASRSSSGPRARTWSTRIALKLFCCSYWPLAIGPEPIASSQEPRANRQRRASSDKLEASRRLRENIDTSDFRDRFERSATHLRLHPSPFRVGDDGRRQSVPHIADPRSARAGHLPVSGRRALRLALHSEGAQRPGATRHDARAEATGARAPGRRPQPARLHQSRQHHEPG